MKTYPKNPLGQQTFYSKNIAIMMILTWFIFGVIALNVVFFFFFFFRMHSLSDSTRSEFLSMSTRHSQCDLQYIHVREWLINQSTFFLQRSQSMWLMQALGFLLSAMPDEEIPEKLLSLLSPRIQELEQLAKQAVRIKPAPYAAQIITSK